jgi:hypothetical protein
MSAQIICDACGFRGLSHSPYFERRHVIYHDEHFNGVRLRRGDSFELVGRIDGAELYLVRPESPRFPRLRAERLSRRAIDEPVAEGGYDKPTFYAEDRYQIVPQHHTHALVLAQASRGVGLLVFERRERQARYDWEEAESHYVLAVGIPAGGAWTLVHIWLLPSLRQKGLATRMIKMVLSGLRTEPTAIVWQTPLTAAGFGLVRYFAPQFFWAAGDTPPQPDTFDRPFDTSDAA